MCEELRALAHMVPVKAITSWSEYIEQRKKHLASDVNEFEHHLERVDAR